MLMQQQESAAWKLHNPFTFRVGQVFTGFGVGCGIGIGVGQAINLRALPVIGSVAGEAIGSFNSFRPHVASLGKKLGIKNIQAGVGCGVGIGHGFGIGVTLKPGTVQQLKQLMEQTYSAVNERVKSSMGSSRSEESSGNGENTTPINERKTSQEIIPTNSITTTTASLGDSMQSTSMAATKMQSAQEPTYGEVNRLQAENRILLTLLTHQEQIELLRKENAALKQAIAEVEDATSSKSKASSDEAEHSRVIEQHKRMTKCFECRRKGWQRR